jgi:hypothetical protein
MKRPWWLKWILLIVAAAALYGIVREAVYPHDTCLGCFTPSAGPGLEE